jgi:hypothetical protein
MKTWLAALLTLLAALPAIAADKLTLGFMSTLSGPAAVIGQDIRDGMRLGLDHVNNRVGGLPTTVLVEDDRQKLEVAVELANKFIKQDRVDAIIGLSFSNLLLAIYPRSSRRRRCSSAPIPARRRSPERIVQNSSSPPPGKATTGPRRWAPICKRPACRTCT